MRARLVPGARRQPRPGDVRFGERAIGSPAFGVILRSAPGSSRLQHVAVSILVEHRRGRRLAELLRDERVLGACSPEQLRLLLEQPVFVRALRDDLRGALGSAVRRAEPAAPGSAR